MFHTKHTNRAENTDLPRDAKINTTIILTVLLVGVEATNISHKQNTLVTTPHKELLGWWLSSCCCSDYDSVYGNHDSGCGHATYQDE